MLPTPDTPLCVHPPSIHAGVFDPCLPYGGLGESGMGKEFGLEGLEAYTESRTVVVCPPRRG